MSGSLYGRQTVNFGQPNALLDVSNFARGENDALAMERNRLMLDRAQMENANDQAFRSAAPGAIGGDPAAMNAAIAADPGRGMALQTQLASLDAGKRKRVMENMTLLGQVAASLTSLPEPDAAREYPVRLEFLKNAGVDISALPPAYPGHAGARSFAASLTPIKDQLERLDNQIVAAGDMSQPRGLRNNNLLNIEAGQFTQSMPGFKGSDGRFAVFESPEQGIAAADALLMRYGMQGRNTPAKIIEKWAPAGDGNNVSAYAGSVARALGIGPNDPIPMEDPAARRRLIDAMSAVENGKRGPQPLVRQGNGMPVTQGAQPGMQWAQGPGGQRVQMPIPGAGERIKPPEGFRYSADGTQFEAIPGGPNDPNYKAQVKAAERGDGPYQGTGMDAQDANILLRGDPTTQEYAAAFNRQNSPRFFPDGGRVDPNMSAYRPPQYAGPGVPQTRGGAAMEPGNIDLNSRPVVRLQDGSIATVRSMSFNDGPGREVLIPTVSDDGKIMGDDEAVAAYRQTGRHLGIFRTPDEATAYAKQLSAAQGKQYGASSPTGGMTRATPGSSAADRTKLKTIETDAASIMSALDGYVATRARAGTGERIWSATGGPSELNTTFNVAAMLAKGEALFNLGVLNGPDLDIIRRTLADPGTVRGGFASQDTVKAQVDVIKNLLTDRLNTARQQYGGVTDGAASAPNAQTSSGPTAGAKLRFNPQTGKIE